MMNWGDFSVVYAILLLIVGFTVVAFGYWKLSFFFWITTALLMLTDELIERGWWMEELRGMWVLGSTGIGSGLGGAIYIVLELTDPPKAWGIFLTALAVVATAVISLWSTREIKEELP